MQRRTLPLFILPLTLALTACPTASDPQPPIDAGAESVRGYVSLSESGVGAEATRSAYASFERVDAGQDEDADSGAPEGCAIMTDDEEPPFEVVFPDDLDAGPHVTLRGAGQPYAVLEKVEGLNGIFYSTGGALGLINLPPMPASGVSATVPGAAFPTFEDAALPPLPPAFTLDNAEALTPLTPESRLTWTPAPTTGDMRTSVGFSAYHFGEDGGYIFLWCMGADDGDFAFTGEVGRVLTEKGFSNGQFLDFSRFAERTERRQGAALVLSTSVTTPAATPVTTEALGAAETAPDLDQLIMLRKATPLPFPYRLHLFRMDPTG